MGMCQSLRIRFFKLCYFHCVCVGVFGITIQVSEYMHKSKGNNEKSFFFGGGGESVNQDKNCIISSSTFLYLK